MVTINKRPADGGYYFEIDDFHQYAAELAACGIEPPKAQYRVFVPFSDDRTLWQSSNDWRRALEIFYRLGPTTGIPCEITANGSGDVA